MKNLKKISCLLLTIILIGIGITVQASEFPSRGIEEAKHENIKLSPKQQLEVNLDYMYQTLDNPGFGTGGGEWTILTLARGGYHAPEEYYDLYYNNVVEKVKELMVKNDGKLHWAKGTEHSRLMLGFGSIGRDITDVGGYDIRKALGDFKYATRQGINGPIFALIALDTHGYEIPVVDGVEEQSTRQKFVDYIIEREIQQNTGEIGGWALTRNNPDPDITAMAIQGLTPYYNQPVVKAVVDRAIDWLSKVQSADGGYFSWGSENVESASQVVVALTGLGIDPHTDPRFVKNEKSIVDNILTFAFPDGGFMHVKPGGNTGGGAAAGVKDGMATDQGTYALVAYDRLVNGQNRLYDMTDVKKTKNQAAKEDTKSKPNIGLADKHKDINKMNIVNPSITFDDISGAKGHKYQIAIEALASRGIITGKTEKIFDPDGNMTRAEFATIVVRGLGIELVEKQIFKDVNTSDWFYKFVSTANEYGIVNGISKDEFNPNGTITKQEAVTMLARGAKLAGMKVETNNMTIRDVLSQFEDYVIVEEWAMSSLAFAYNEDILDDSSMKINPKQIITRSEIAQMLFNMLDKANLL